MVFAFNAVCHAAAHETEWLNRGPHRRGLRVLPVPPVLYSCQSCSIPFQPFPFIIYYSPQIVLYQLLSILHNVLKLPHLPHSGPKPATFLSPAEEQQLVCLAQPLSVPADTSQPLSHRYSPRRIDRSRFHRASSRAGGFQRGTVCQKAFH